MIVDETDLDLHFRSGDFDSSINSAHCQWYFQCQIATSVRENEAKIIENFSFLSSYFQLERHVDFWENFLFYRCKSIVENLSLWLVERWISFSTRSSSTRIHRRWNRFAIREIRFDADWKRKSEKNKTSIEIDEKKTPRDEIFI